jgi:hypothetical protein
MCLIPFNYNATSPSTHTKRFNFIWKDLGWNELHFHGCYFANHSPQQELPMAHNASTWLYVINLQCQDCYFMNLSSWVWARNNILKIFLPHWQVHFLINLVDMEKYFSISFIIPCGIIILRQFKMSKLYVISHLKIILW